MTPQPAPSSRPLLRTACALPAWVMLHPLRVPSLITPGHLGLAYRRVRLTRSGVTLAAWHIPREGSRRGLVLCHGHDNSRNQFRAMLRPLHAAGFHLFLFDFRGMGISGSSPCTYGFQEVSDAAEAVRWLREEAGVEQVGLYGISMGGATALLTAARDPSIRAMVTDSAFADLSEMVEHKLFFLPRPARTAVAREVRGLAEGWTGADVRRVSPEAELRASAARPALIIHGERDLLVPVDHARRLHRAAGPHAELWTLPRAGHVGCRRAAGHTRYAERVCGFFERNVRKSEI